MTTPLKSELFDEDMDGGPPVPPLCGVGCGEPRPLLSDGAVARVCGTVVLLGLMVLAGWVVVAAPAIAIMVLRGIVIALCVMAFLIFAAIMN
jgi:hypothetical protein